MKLSLEKKQEKKISFVASGITSTFANILRRYVLARIPTIAIEKVTFYDNTSALWDEYISHRLGLIPILTPKKVPKDVEIAMTLDAEGPKTVYSADLISADSEAKAGVEKIVILTLAQNQRIRLEARAKLDDARSHAKHQAGLMAYDQKDDDKFDMFVETFHQMSAEEVLLRACDKVIEDLEEIEKELK